MMRILLVVSATLLISSASASWFSVGTKPNTLMVRYSVVPDMFFHSSSFINMPRTVSKAEKDGWRLALTREDTTRVFCPADEKNKDEMDHRVCLLFDGKGSVAGIQISVTKQELEESKPQSLDVSKIPEVMEHTFLGKPMYSSIAYFVNDAIVKAGGRDLSDDDLTVPEGVWFVQFDDSGKESGRLHVSLDEADATSAGFTEQNCFPGMGKHYFQELRKTGSCENHRPYFLLYGPDSKRLNGIGFAMFGKTSQGNGWFETPPTLATQMIAPNSPSCMKDWSGSTGLFTMHVYFVENPYFTFCLP